MICPDIREFLLDFFEIDVIENGFDIIDGYV